MYCVCEKMKKFSLEKAVKADSKKDKRPKVDETPSRASKFLKVSQITIEEGPKPERPSVKKLQPDAPVIVTIYKATDIAGDMWEAFQGEKKKLWQIQIAHEVPRPITYQFRDRFASFIKTYDKVPDSLQELEQEGGIRIVTADANDPENVGTYFLYT